MKCGGCVKAVNDALSAVSGIENFNIDLEKQLVTAKASVPQEILLEAISKAGKKCSPLS